MNWHLCSNQCQPYLQFVSGFVKQGGLELTVSPIWNGNLFVFASPVLQLKAWVTTINLTLLNSPRFIYLCVYEYMCTCVETKRVMLPPLSFSAYFIEAGSLPEPRGHFFWDRLEASKPQKPLYLCLPWSRVCRMAILLWGVLEPELWSS